MKSTYQPITPGRCLLGGLFTGIIAAVIVVIFNVVYREAVDLSAYEIVMPLSIFMAFPLLNLLAGGIYFLFVGHLKKGPQMFTIIVLLVMILCALVTIFSGRRSGHTVEDFKGLLLGMELIEGIMAAFLLPFFAKHPNIYLTANDMAGRE